MMKFRLLCLISSFSKRCLRYIPGTADIFSIAIISWPAFFQTLIYIADSFGEEFLIVDFFPEYTESYMSDFDSRCSIIDQMAVGVALKHVRNCWVTILPEYGVDDL